MKSRGIGLEAIQCKSDGGNEGKSMYANRCIGQFKLIGALLLLLQDGSLFREEVTEGGWNVHERERDLIGTEVACVSHWYVYFWNNVVVSTLDESLEGNRKYLSRTWL